MTNHLAENPQPENMLLQKHGVAIGDIVEVSKKETEVIESPEALQLSTTITHTIMDQRNPINQELIITNGEEKIEDTPATKNGTVRRMSLTCIRNAHQPSIEEDMNRDAESFYVSFNILGAVSILVGIIMIILAYIAYNDRSVSPELKTKLADSNLGCDNCDGRVNVRKCRAWVAVLDGFIITIGAIFIFPCISTYLHRASFHEVAECGNPGIVFVCFGLFFQFIPAAYILWNINSNEDLRISGPCTFMFEGLFFYIMGIVFILICSKK